MTDLEQLEVAIETEADLEQLRRLAKIALAAWKNADQTIQDISRIL